MAKSTKRIGTDAEKMVESILRGQGYIVHRTWPQWFPLRPGVWRSKAVDFLGCFDILAVKNGERPRYIQVKTGTRWAEAMATIEAKEPESGWPTDHMSIEIWCDMMRPWDQCCEEAKRPNAKHGARELYRKWKFFAIKNLDDGFVEKTREHHVA